jgi:hypothetical protein
MSVKVMLCVVPSDVRIVMLSDVRPVIIPFTVVSWANAWTNIMQLKATLKVIVRASILFIAVPLP